MELVKLHRGRDFKHFISYRILYTLLLLCCCLSLYSQTYKEPEYKFLDKFENSDLNYEQIDSINSAEKGIKMLNSTFNVIKGDYTIYRFMTYDRGVVFDEHIDNMNDLIILKVDNNKIIDGYQYFLQNPEMPSTCHLYRLTKKKKLTHKMQISSLKFKRVYQSTNKDYEVCNETPIFLTDKRYLMW